MMLANSHFLTDIYGISTENNFKAIKAFLLEFMPGESYLSKSENSYF